MMKKKLLAALLIGALCASLFTSCSGGDTASSGSSSSDTSSSETLSSEMESSQAESSEAAPSEESGDASASDGVALSTILDAVKNAYGENYLPSMDLTEEDLKTRFGLNSADYTEALGQVAMISTQVDTFVAVHAKEGKADAVVSALNTYRDDLVNNSMQYPMNVAKVNASKVYQNGDYVFFIMLGTFAPDDIVDDEEASVKFHEEQNDIAIQAIDETLAG